MIVFFKILPLWNILELQACFIKFLGNLSLSVYLCFNNFFLIEIFWWPLLIFIHIFFIFLFLSEKLTTRIFTFNLRKLKTVKGKFFQRKIGTNINYFNILIFFTKYCIFIYILLFFNTSYFFSYLNFMYFYNFNLTNTFWYYSIIIYFFSIIVFIFIHFSIFYNFLKSIEFLIGLNFFLLVLHYLLAINNFLIIIFIFEFQSLIFIFLISSSFSHNFIFQQKLNLILDQPIWFFNSLIFQFWISFIGTILLVYSLMSFLKYTSFIEWYNLNLFLHFSKFSDLNFLDFQFIFYLFVFMLSILLKLGFFPFFLWKPEIYKNLNFLVLFMYMSIYLFSIIFFVLVLISQYFNLINIYLFIYVYVLFTIVLILFPFFLYSISEIRSFLGYSSIIHVGFILMAVFYSFNLSLFYLFVYISYIILFFSIFFFISGLNFWYFTDLQYIVKYPLLNFSLLVFFLGLAGLPPFLGFFSKMSIISIFLVYQDYLLFFLSIFSSLYIAFFYIQNYRFFGVSTKMVNYKNNLILLNSNSFLYFIILIIVYVNIFSIFYVNDFFIFVQIFKF